MVSLHYNKRSKAELANRISDVLISCTLSFRLLIVLWKRRHTGPPFLREKVLQNDSKNKLIRENPFAWAHAPGHVLLTMYSTPKDIIHFTEITQ